MDKLENLFCKIFKISKNELNDNLNKDDIECWDSLTHMELITAIEENFNIDLTMDDIVEMVTIKKIKEVVYREIRDGNKK